MPLSAEVKGPIDKDMTASFTVFERAVTVEAERITREVAQWMVDEAKDIIASQRYRWKPLSEKYLEWKKKNNHDTRILVMTGEYREAIGWWEDKGQIFVGLRSDDLHDLTGIPLNQIARYLEFGTPKMPARQLWRPLLSIAVRKFPEFGELYRSRVREAVRRQRVAKAAASKV